MYKFYVDNRVDKVLKSVYNSLITVGGMCVDCLLLTFNNSPQAELG